MTIKEIVTKYLQDNGFEGLCGTACGCFLNDLMPCEEMNTGCEAGYVKIVSDEDEATWFNCDVGDKIVCNERLALVSSDVRCK